MNYTVKEILKSTVVLLGLDDRIACTDADDADTDLLVKLLNLVAVSLSARLPLETTETVRTTREGDLYYCALSRPVTRILSVRDGKGSVRGVRLSDRMNTSVKDGEVTVRYAYRPDALKLADTTEFGPVLLPLTAIVYALAAEYCLVMAMYDTAEQWQARFETEYRRAAALAAVRVPARSFV